MTTPQIITSTPNNFKHRKENQEVYNGTEALNFTRLTSGIIVANAISHNRVNGDIYVAIGLYGGPVNGDTLRIFRSTNNGLTFTVISSFFEGFKLENNGLDVEAVSRGDSAFVFVAMNYFVDAAKGTAVFRVRQDGGMFNVKAFSGLTNRYINGRITSDNAAYTNGAYVYFSFTLDSLASGIRWLRSKLYRFENPFDPEFPIIAGYQAPGSGKYAYYVDEPAPDSATFESDIAFINTASDSDQVYTVTIVRGMGGAYNGGTSLHFSKSSTYGATLPSFFYTEDAPYLKESPRMVSTGYLNNSIMILTRRLYGGGDWDPYYFYSAGINSGAPVFSKDYVSSTSDTTIGVSVAGRSRSAGTYLFAFNNKMGSYGNVYIRPFVSGTQGTIVQVNPIIAANLYGNPDASFRNVNNDSCLVIWGGISGNGSYVTGGCSGTFTSVENPNMSVNDFHLYQNYPNPFNPTTKISYNLPSTGKVSVRIFDVMGKKVAEVVNEIQSTGFHSVDFNGVNLSSGVYYYRIEANGFIDTKKMILLK